MAPTAEADDAIAAEVSSSRWSQPFEAILRRILAEYEGTEDKVRDGMETGMRKLFEKPYPEELIKDGEPLPLDDARRIFFFPTLSDMGIYVEAFSRDTPENTARRERLMKFKLMSVFYTVHRRDGALMDRFMHCGGLAALVSILGEDHRVIQSQAVELLMELVSPLMQQLELPPSASLRQQHLHSQVYSCLRSAAFWKNVSKIVAEPHEVFPKSHASCIRILAGAVGWLRPPEAGVGPGGPAPGVSLNTHAAKEALSDFQKSDLYKASMPDVKGISEDLLDELVQGALCRNNPLASADLKDAKEDLFASDTEAREAASHIWQSLRQLGNEAFKAGLVWPAEASYRLALLDGGSVVPAAEASLIESNRALVLLRAGHHVDAAAAAAQALAKNPRNAKAAFRRATALLELSSQSASTSQEACAASAADAVVAAEQAAQLEPSDAKVLELLERARRRAEELGPPPDDVLKHKDVPQAEEALDDMD